MKKTVVIFILSLLAWNVVAQERDLAADARRAFEEGRYADAVELYGAVYIQDGKDYSHEKEIASQCLTKMLEAIAAVNINQVEDAVAAYQFVLSKNPKDPVASEYVRNYDDSAIADGYINGHGYVDLGLPSGLKWAIYNLGAVTPEDYGNYYKWGNTSVHNIAKNSMTEHKSIKKLRKEGIIDFKNQLTPTYDAANVNWGADWRMPTKLEWEELIDKCIWTWRTQNGINGYKIVGPSGKSIFLPVAGYKGIGIFEAGEYGTYWSSTVIPKDYDLFAFELFVSQLNQCVRSGFRGIGNSVRAVSK